jgi:WhiB family redox-sensing transcriptional regulator
MTQRRGTSENILKTYTEAGSWVDGVDLEREDWKDQGSCRSSDPDAFFPDKGDPWGAKEAVRVCRMCPVQRDCLEYALRREERFGIWGGIASWNRRSLHRLVDGGADPADVVSVTLSKMARTA